MLLVKKLVAYKRSTALDGEFEAVKTLLLLVVLVGVPEKTSE
jgi:hypothetical protein